MRDYPTGRTLDEANRMLAIRTDELRDARRLMWRAIRVACAMACLLGALAIFG